MEWIETIAGCIWFGYAATLFFTGNAEAAFLPFMLGVASIRVIQQHKQMQVLAKDNYYLTQLVDKIHQDVTSEIGLMRTKEIFKKNA